MTFCRSEIFSRQGRSSINNCKQRSECPLLSRSAGRSAVLCRRPPPGSALVHYLESAVLGEADGQVTPADLIVTAQRNIYWLGSRSAANDDLSFVYRYDAFTGSAPPDLQLIEFGFSRSYLCHLLAVAFRAAFAHLGHFIFGRRRNSYDGRRSSRRWSG